MYFILIFVITMIVVGGSCKNSGFSQNCNPTTGDCYCDATHKLGPDKKTCTGNVLSIADNIPLACMQAASHYFVHCAHLIFYACQDMFEVSFLRPYEFIKQV